MVYRWSRSPKVQVFPVLMLLIWVGVACGGAAAPPAVVAPEAKEAPPAAVAPEVPPATAAPEAIEAPPAAVAAPTRERPLDSSAGRERVVKEGPDIPKALYEGGEGGAPKTCDPRNPELIRPNEQDITIERQSSIVEEGVSIVVQYENKAGQRFALILHALNVEVALGYVKDLALCFEAIEVGQPIDNGGRSIQLGDLFLNSLRMHYGLSADQLREHRDNRLGRRVGGDHPNLEVVLKDLGINPEEVLKQSVNDASVVIGQSLPQEEVKKLVDRLPEVYRFILQDEDFGVLSEKEYTTLDLADALRADPRGLVVEAEWTNPPLEKVENFNIFYVIDPPLSQKAWHAYSWLRRTSVSAGIWVTVGKVYLELGTWVPPYSALGDDTGIATGPVFAGWLEESTSWKQWYRVFTYGYRPSNDYYMYGSWRYSSFDTW